MKVQEMIDNGDITAEDAKIGYVSAFPYAEVKSGYSSFFLGVRSIVKEATMEVVPPVYDNTSEIVDNQLYVMKNAFSNIST